MVDPNKKLQQQLVPLENAILKATSETLQKPDEAAFKEACELINSKADMLPTIYLLKIKIFLLGPRKQSK